MEIQCIYCGKIFAANESDVHKCTVNVSNRANGIFNICRIIGLIIFFIAITLVVIFK